MNAPFGAGRTGFAGKAEQGKKKANEKVKMLKLTSLHKAKKYANDKDIGSICFSGRKQ